MKRLALVLVLAAACAAPVGTSGVYSAPRDSGPQCASICHDMGLALDAVVVMANNVGCVCATMAPPPGAPGAAPAPAASPSAHSGGAAGGMAAIMLQQQAEQRSSHR